MPRILIVAYGNPLRSDDGLAWRAAEQLEKKVSQPDVEILTLHQLTPEVAETCRRFQCVIFVDAASRDEAGNGTAGEVRVRKIQTQKDSAGRATRFSHALSPDAIVDMSAQLYGANPRAFSVTMTGDDFGHGESLSATVTAALPLLVDRIEKVVKEVLGAGE
ncbi:MAG: hydrogenase maturation protease [Terriglobales bacterium]